jgi:hypothetical protein
MTRFIWQVRYALIALRSRYKLPALEAWREARASWEHHTAEGPITPAHAFAEDAFEWRLSA